LGTNDIYKIPGADTYEYTAKITIDYTVSNSAFGTRQFVTINI